MLRDQSLGLDGGDARHVTLCVCTAYCNPRLTIEKKGDGFLEYIGPIGEFLGIPFNAISQGS